MIPEHRRGHQQSLNGGAEDMAAAQAPAAGAAGAHHGPRVEGRDLDEEQELEEYQMLSQLFDYDALREEPAFGAKRYKDSLYKGTLVDRKRAGLGVLIYASGRVYEGEWQDERRNGRGFEVYTNGSQYVGQYCNNKAHGKGVYTWLNGELYDGEWAMGLKHGFGIWKGTAGDSYIGEWRDSKVEGYGVHQWKNGDRYEGEWVDCLKHGQGTDIFANGDVHIGTYAHGKPHGFGQYKWRNGASYVGNFAHGLKDGHGKWRKDKRPNCNNYDGYFLNDMKHGRGIFSWESGNRYDGHYAYDQRQGYGEMYWSDGSVYKGNWHKGQQSGIGCLQLPDGTVKEGRFKNNKYLGPVHQVSQVGTINEEDDEECPPAEPPGDTDVDGGLGPEAAEAGVQTTEKEPWNSSPEERKDLSQRPNEEPLAKSAVRLAEDAEPPGPLFVQHRNDKKASKGYQMDGRGHSLTRDFSPDAPKCMATQTIEDRIEAMRSPLAGEQIGGQRSPELGTQSVDAQTQIDPHEVERHKEVPKRPVGAGSSAVPAGTKTSETQTIEMQTIETQTIDPSPASRRQSIPSLKEVQDVRRQEVGVQKSPALPRSLTNSSSGEHMNPSKADEGTRMSTMM